MHSGRGGLRDDSIGESIHRSIPLTDSSQPVGGDPVHWSLFKDSPVPFQPPRLIFPGLDCDWFWGTVVMRIPIKESLIPVIARWKGRAIKLVSAAGGRGRLFFHKQGCNSTVCQCRKFFTLIFSQWGPSWLFQMSAQQKLLWALCLWAPPFGKGDYSSKSPVTLLCQLK